MTFFFYKLVFKFIDSRYFFMSFLAREFIYNISDLSDGGHVEPVDVVPPVDLVVLVLPVLYSGHVHGRSE